MTAPGRPEGAAGLAQRWQELARRHVAVAFGCACGAPTGHIRLPDLEGDILAYLRHRYPPGCDPAIDTLFAPDSAGGGGTLPSVLRRIAPMGDDPSPLIQQFTAELERSIASCERSVGGRKRMLQADGGAPAS